MLYLKRIISVFWEPSKTFSSIKERVSWLDFLIPFLVVVIVSLATIPYVTPIAVKEQVARIEKSDKIPESRKEEIIERIESNPVGVRSYIISPIVIGVSILITALLIQLVANFILGGEVKFLSAVAIYSYANLVGILGYLVKVPLMVSRGTTKVYTSLAVFLEPSGTFIFRFFNAVDVFTVWKVLLIGFGVGIFTGVKPSKAISVMLVAWLVLALILAGLSSLSPVF